MLTKKRYNISDDGLWCVESNDVNENMSVLTPLDSTHHEVFLGIFFDFSKF
jgi:hypothetical protein